VHYAYDGQNKRIWQATFSNQSGNWVFAGDSISLFGIDGKLIGTYTAGAAWNQTQTQLPLSFYTQTQRAYFGKKLVASGQTLLPAIQDRLESVGRYYPFGEERNSPPTSNDQVKFASYTRDSATGLDYADQRYYFSTLGRFMSPDPSKASGGASRPNSWNRYTYVSSNPVNLDDPHGLLEADPICGPEGEFCEGDPDLVGSGVYNGGGGGGGTCGMGFSPNPETGECDGDPTPDPPPPDPWRCPTVYQNWINAHGTDAATVANSVNNTEANLLALSAYESGWGKGYFVQADAQHTGNAFFNLEITKSKKISNPALFPYSTGWKPARGDANVLVAQYKSYLDSAKSFAAVYGASINGIKDTTAFGTYVSHHGFGITVSTFVSIADIFVKCLH
jgi:RHS repeat-associated protein